MSGPSKIVMKSVEAGGEKRPPVRGRVDPVTSPNNVEHQSAGRRLVDPVVSNGSPL